MAQIPQKLQYKDNGIGLDYSYAEKIFTAIERLHSKDQYEGNGIGLALCIKIAKRHNGTISATGEKDNGAEFKVILPLKQAAFEKQSIHFAFPTQTLLINKQKDDSKINVNT